MLLVALWYPSAFLPGHLTLWTLLCPPPRPEAVGQLPGGERKAGVEGQPGTPSHLSSRGLTSEPGNEAGVRLEGDGPSQCRSF